MTPAELYELVRPTIDDDTLRAIQKRFPNSTWDKFFAFTSHLLASCGHAVRIHGMIGARCRVLDLGCGFGYTAAAMQMLGHDVTAWDADTPVLREAAKAVPVKHRVFETIHRPMKPLNEGDFDFIFLHGVVPLRDAFGWWELADYKQLAQNLFSSTEPGGRIEWIVNRGEHGACVLQQSAWDVAFSRRQLIVDDNVVMIQKSAEPVHV